MDLFRELPTNRCLPAIRGRHRRQPPNQLPQLLLLELLCFSQPRNPWSLDCPETEQRCPCSGSRNASEIPLLLRRRYDPCINRTLLYSMPCSFSLLRSWDCTRVPVTAGSARFELVVT